ncbi:MAG: hypothetical protein Kow0092_30990 [Deferrisomatales bacterium]
MPFDRRRAARWLCLVTSVAAWGVLASPARGGDAPGPPPATRPSSPATVLGEVPKALFSTGVLYNLGPAFRREAAAAADGTGFDPVLTVAEWKQTVFELERHKLAPHVLPRFEDYLRRARGRRWEGAARNRLPLLVWDVAFEWIPGDLDRHPALERIAPGRYRLRPGAERSLGVRRGRFFGASLPVGIVRSRLITLALDPDLIVSNRADPLVAVRLAIDGERIELDTGDSQVVDLGDREGTRTVRVTAIHRSGAESRAAFRFRLERLPDGRWANTVEEDGNVRFGTRPLPPTTFTRR